MRPLKPRQAGKRLSEHGTNVNMLFKWRRDLRAGRLAGPAVEGAQLLPVVLKPCVAPAKLPGGSVRTSTVEISIADATIRVSAGVDAGLLQLVLQSVRA